jgi:hypothetical protein
MEQQAKRICKYKAIVERKQATDKQLLNNNNDMYKN